MKRTLYLLCMIFPLYLFSQEHHSIGIGIKAGLNFANVTNASSINGSSQSGFNAGIFFAPQSKSIIGNHTELVFSRQGYNYADGSSTSAVNLDYLCFAQLMAINITKFVSIQVGMHFAYLLNAKANGSSEYNTGNNQVNQILDYYNRYDYGFGGGVEIHPYKGIIVGARYNISINQLYKSYTSFPTTDSIPPFIPNSSSINLKNNLVQIYAGYRF